ncbi:MAG: septum formation inhibitor Maf [Synergistes sp.]|nr:septum formation inhibitor Maf [Synergistes sp.]
MIKFILASGSPRRRELLTAIGWEFEVIPSQSEEKLSESETPSELVMRLAREKAAEVAEKYPGRCVLGADTVVTIDGRVLGKPSSEREAAEMIAQLSGREHSVITGVALIASDGRLINEYEETVVTFRDLSKDEIDAYISRGESMDKAGAYAIQGYGALLVEGIKGCFFNVVGLPLRRVGKMFEEMGITLSQQWRNSDDQIQ